MTTNSIVVVVNDEEQDPYSKNIASRLASRAIAHINFPDLKNNFEAIVSQLQELMLSQTAHATPYQVTTIEATLEISTKGEVRLLGAAGMEAKGGIKVILSAK